MNVLNRFPTRFLFLYATLALGGLAAPARAAVVTMDALVVDADVTVTVGPAGMGYETGGIVLDTGTLVLAPTGTLDLKNNAMIVRSGNFATIQGYVITGYNGGAWDGYGINSSIAASDPNHLTAVGVINNADAHLTEFHGATLGSNLEILASYAYYGDANLDSYVDDADLAQMALGTAGLGAGWYFGDFNYSGAVDAADYALYTASFNALHPVPEPGVVGLLAVGALACLRRGRR